MEFAKNFGRNAEYSHKWTNMLVEKVTGIHQVCDKILLFFYVMPRLPKKEPNLVLVTVYRFLVS